MKVKLKILMPDGATDVKEFVADSVSIGRDPECDLPVDDGEERRVSWLHARLETDDNAIVLRDFHSKNGTFLNDERVDSAAPLRVGDVVRLGQSGPKLLVLEADPFGFTAVAPESGRAATQEPRSPSGQEGNIFGEPILRYAAAAAVLVLLFLVSLAWIAAAGRADKDGVVEVAAGGENKSAGGGSLQPKTTQLKEGLQGDQKGGARAADDVTKGGRKTTSNETTGKGDDLRIVITPAQIEGKFGQGVVWMGAELQGYKWPLCTGWAVQPKVIVSTGREIAQLKTYLDQGHPVFVFFGDAEGEFVRVTSVRLHPRFDASKPESPGNMWCNIGIAILEKDVLAHRPILPLAQCEGSVVGQEVVALGYSIVSEPQLKPYDRLSAPEFVVRRGKVTGTKAAPNTPDGLPLLLTDLDTTDGMDGAPVFDTSARVLGIKVSVGKQWLMVSSNRVLEVVEESGK